MLIAIVALGLVVVYLASKPLPGSTGLPPDTNIPATGSTGVPSPGWADNPIASTNRGMLAMGTNAPFANITTPKPAWSAKVDSNVIQSAPQGPPDQSKSLVTTPGPLTQFTNDPVGLRKL